MDLLGLQHLDEVPVMVSVAVLTCLPRSNNLKVGKVFADRELEGMTVQELEAAIEGGDQSVLGKLRRWASGILGSNSYWFTERCCFDLGALTETFLLPLGASYTAWFMP